MEVLFITYSVTC